MGTRYLVDITCPKCGFYEDDVWYAPTCGVIEWECPICEHIVDLEEYTGISEEGASNKEVIASIVDSFKIDRKLK